MVKIRSRDRFRKLSPPIGSILYFPLHVILFMLHAAFRCELRDDKDARRVFAATFCGNCKHVQCLWAVAVMVRWGMVDMQMLGVLTFWGQRGQATLRWGLRCLPPAEANWCMAAVAPLAAPNQAQQRPGQGQQGPHAALLPHRAW